ncbi:MAG: TonB-dependent receptor [Candidatus Marinimicrobia bacterium]|nr:TonB-dependent receptor [Candidatus Neomarinimicrobiota bacterium]
MGSPIIRKYHLLLTAALVASLPVISYPATIKGVVKNQMTRVNIEGALIILLRPADSDYYQSAVSDASGRFALADIRSGEYYLEVRKDGFFSNAMFDLEVTTDEDYTVKIKLLPSEGKQGSEYSFMLGGIEVKADRIDVIPDEIATTRKIDSGEIEHMQATNLGDVLALIPGVEKNTSPGLAKPVSVGIRSVRSGGGYIEGVEAFGTTIIVDGDCISNDINAKQKGGIGETGSSGIDLRGIPADNIKSVEVITGVPSVEYGNFARGLILVETKIGVTSPKLKAKLNPDTKSVSFSAGHQVGRTVFDYFLDYGYSERNLREEGDNYQRFYVKGNIARKFIDEKLDLKLRSSYTKRIDSEEPTGDRQLKQYNDGYRASGKIDATYQVNENDKVIGSLSINHENKQYYREKWVNEQLVTPDSIYFGYVGIAEEIGTEWDITGRLKMKGVASGRWFDHKYHIGLEVDYEENNGIGLVLDTLFNYYGVYSTKRSYSFDAYPAYRDFAIYCEDNISGMLLARKFQIELGLRYDVFNPTGVNWGNIWEDKSLLNTRFGEFLLPRVNMRYFINDDLRIRVGAGKFPKRISLAHIYRAAAFVKIFRDSVFVEESYSQANPDLQTYTTNKYEVSVDWRPIDLIGLSLTAYHSETSNRPQTVSYPWGYDFNPDTLTSESYATYENRG